MRQDPVRYRALLLAGFLAAPALAQQAQPIVDLGGSWRCEPEPRPCDPSGKSFTVKQTGNKLLATNDKQETGAAEVTSPISVGMGPPWNMLGTIQANGSVIEWSNGTRWVR